MPRGRMVLWHTLIYHVKKSLLNGRQAHYETLHFLIHAVQLLACMQQAMKWKATDLTRFVQHKGHFGLIPNLYSGKCFALSKWVYLAMFAPIKPPQKYRTSACLHIVFGTPALPR